MPTETELVKDISSTYDDLPYASNPFSQTHPCHLRAICSLFDKATPDPQTANILEIGCSFGGNIIPLAQQYPQASVLGLDLSGRQIAIGQAAIKTMGLSNIRLQQQDITTYNTPLKHFDYIICHGVYSWVPEPVREAILQVIAKGLSDTGIAFVSYNTYPGWKISEVYRDAMLYRSQPVDNIIDKIKYGFGMLDFLKAHLPKASPWGVAIEQHYNNIRHADTSYIAHEYLEIVNEPCYFHEFMGLAQKNGLHFVAEADFQNHFFPPVGLDHESYEALKREADGDIIKLEQLSDFLTSRLFRQTILTRSPDTQALISGGKELRHDALSALHIQGLFSKETNQETQKPQWQPMTHSNVTAFKDMPVTAYIFNQLNAANGQTRKVAELWEKAQTENHTFDKETFFNTIAEIILQRAVRIRSAALQWETTNSKPHVSAATRELFKWIKNHPSTIGLSTAQHTAITLDVIADELLPALDGKHSREDLYQRLTEAVTAGRVVFYDHQKQRISDTKDIDKAAKEHTERLLDVLQYNGFLR